MSYVRLDSEDKLGKNSVYRYKNTQVYVPYSLINFRVGHLGPFLEIILIMDKIAYIVDGGFFTKKFNAFKKAFPTGDEIERYIM